MARSTHTASGRPKVKRQVELLLADDVESLGKRGDVVRVRPGFARNYLLPNGFATLATEAMKKLLCTKMSARCNLLELPQENRYQAHQALEEQTGLGGKKTWARWQPSSK